MSHFSEIIDYDVPSFHRLKDEFKANAIISDRGKTITVGDHSARRVGFMTNIFYKATWYAVKAPGDRFGGILHIPNSESEHCISKVVDNLAEREAIRSVPVAEKNQALKEALEKHLDRLNAK